MGYIVECRDAGLPDTLLIPIRPPFRNQITGEVEGGKAPSVPNAMGEWQGLKGWEKCNTPWALKEQADAAGSNVGLILGCGEDVTYAALDIDLNPGQETHRNRLLNLLGVNHRERDMLVRETVPYRALVLIRVKDTIHPGKKVVYYLEHKGEKIGKIELLTTNQQCVIAGRHPIAGPIQWVIHGQETRTPVPRPTPNMVEYATFLDLAESVRNWLEEAGKFGYYFEATSVGRGETVPEADLVPEWLTTDVLVQIIKDSPNPKSADRDQYVAFMEAIAACKHGIEARQGPLSSARTEQIGIAAAEWAKKWPGNTSPDAFETEKAKWDNDWSKNRGGYSTGWTRLTELSREFGYSEARGLDAAYEFDHAQLILPKPKSEAPAPEDCPIITVREHEFLGYIENSHLSDFTITNYIRRVRGLDQQTAFMPAINRWLLWDGKRGGWRLDDQFDSTFSCMVTAELHQYVSKFANAGAEDEKWKKSEINSVLSVSRMRNVKTALSHALAKSDDMIKSHQCHLQTPGGTYDLRTGELIGSALRKEQFEPRYTNVTPIWNNSSTPLFDSLLLGLADGNEDVVEWMWHYLGYCLLGDPRADCFLVIWGSGKNGKSVLVNVLNHILGDYLVDLDAKVLLDTGKNDHPTALNRLRKKRLAVVSEMPHKDRWNEQLLKKITGGDMIQARAMGQDMSEFRCEAGLLIVCNDVPSFSHVTPAILRRFRMIGTTWQPLEPDGSLEEKIKMLESGIVLAKLMQYAQKVWCPENEAYEHVKLPDPPLAMMTEAEATLSAGDPIYAWVKDECEFGPKHAEDMESIDLLKSRFDAWQARNNNGVIVGDNVNEKVFLAALRRMGIADRDSHGGRLRKSIAVNGVKDKVAVVRGIRLKVKQVA